ncbi:phosphoribosylformylglycinamidine synthase [Herbinix luporum]|mgnify:CR=1 FL=1|jgi:phosphoribosylformylglycinamidine synthase|uniref:phosphoribosylformylglycinamidine synthase n=1 Tax=Herbinix luporum TaxID=1679721 RepID=UPI0017545D79|nr:phosphoribosylformylglycinamidine synthase [Herbinix luporum]MDI9488139.1 phosphoribosylformylglycinamidine synthase [Bacillota bacterium]HHT56345.1 phosphoribosylformylglycinamidine synthase [Herbinix luporum]
MSMVRRIYVEKKEPYNVRGKLLAKELTNYLGINGVESVRVLNRYLIENVSEDNYKLAINTVFMDPSVDIIHEETIDIKSGERVFSVEYLPGQYDQRADSAEQCIKLLDENSEPIVRSATTYIISGNISEEDFNKIKSYCINSVDSRETEEITPKSLITRQEEPKEVDILTGFKDMDKEELENLYNSLNLAMTIADFIHIQNYFKNEENRDPSITEIRVLDTYWSDHCRHTTFLTELKSIDFEDGYYTEPIKAAYYNYTSDREKLYKGRDDKYISLMDIATLAMKKLRAEGKLDDMEVSDEINACTIIVPVEVDGKTEEWLLFFKNETHNHPTEIEPFGGAATCLGGAIRDPLSGRGYAYQAMRLSAAADPTQSFNDTLEGKLPQRKICRQAAEGYSSYGNQIGLPSGLVEEIYHPGYVAKRMEAGAIMAAAPRKHVKREKCEPGDLVILLGGRTGRDGLGGATGSSKSHTTESAQTSGAEVQKGNPAIERNILRLFRRPEASILIKKCNDFGAGGVSVAIGELADGLRINLDKLPTKYEGLDGTELAISESQERMAIVVDAKDADTMLAYAKEENLEAVVVAQVTDTNRLVIEWRGKEIVNLSRAFLNTNGAHQEATAYVTIPSEKDNYLKKGALNLEDKASIKDKWLKVLSDLNVSSKKGLTQMFDSSIGAATVTMPFGGQYQYSPIQTMVAKLPVLEGKCDNVSMMSYGFDPYLSSWSPFHGAVYAVISSVAKIVASGGDYSKIRFSFQEFFRRLEKDPKRWGEPLAALLGAYEAQMKLELPSIGGKDSMSGTFNDIDVPPTLVSFAVNMATSKDVITTELKSPGNVLVRFKLSRDSFDLPVYEKLKALYSNLYKLMKDKKAVSAYAIGFGGIIEAVSKMAFGNKLGVSIKENLDESELFLPDYGSILIEMKKDDTQKLSEYGFTADDYDVIGEITQEESFRYGSEVITIDEALQAWTNTLEEIYPTKSDSVKEEVYTKLYDAKKVYVAKNKVAKPKVFIPVLPGSNCDYDTFMAFKAAGAEVEKVVFSNMFPGSIKESIEAFEKAIKEAQIIVFSGGNFTAEIPDGSGKYTALVFRNEKIKEAMDDFLNNRDGLALGISNGFHALIRLGLLPYGEIRPVKEDTPALIAGNLGKHIAKYVNTKVISNASPWLMKTQLNSIYTLPTSHGEGRFVAGEELIKELFEKGQVASQYVDLNGNPTMDEEYNPHGSYYAIESIISPDGRVMGKMTHPERTGDSVAINIYGNQNMGIIESGVSYFK